MSRKINTWSSGAQNKPLAENCCLFSVAVGRQPFVFLPRERRIPPARGSAGILTIPASVASTRCKVTAVELMIRCYRDPESKTEESAPPLPLLSPQKRLPGRFRNDNRTLKLFSCTKEALKIFRTGFFFPSGTRSGVRRNCHRRWLNTRTDGVPEWFSVSLSVAIFHSWDKARGKMLGYVYV